PRLNVAFPVTDKAQLRFSYGAFTQLPSLAYIFSRPNCGVCESNNPGDLEYSRTDAFEGGVSYIVSQDVLFELVAYYRDVTGNVASGKEYFLDYYRYFTQERKRIWHGAGYSNRDDGNIKGLDLVLKKRFSDNYSLDLQYTLQFSRTTGSSPGGGTNLIDAATNERYTPPDELTPISQDRTHQMSARFNYMFPEDFKIGTTAGTILKNVRAHAAFSLMSGTPYSSSRGGYQIGGLNFFRGRWYTNLDLRFTKSFNMGASRRVSVFTEIFNALNRKTNQSYPTYSYYGNLVSARQAVGKDLKWADMSAGNPQRYRFAADFNGDGTLTLDEAALGIIANRMLLATMDKRDWGLARQIRTGVSFSF
ncbi:MAG: hypothetical protein U9P14_07885, partial [Gemmatimonadota bacterium]|nr:hypothetical protein [Gemmatimonadota bacterium]